VKQKRELLTNFNFISIPKMEMLQIEIQSLCDFSFLNFFKLNPQTRFKVYFQKEMPSVPVKHQFSYLSLH
jgi:hypothetical protein